jgi:uncharacterized membrane protein
MNEVAEPRAESSLPAEQPGLRAMRSGNRWWFLLLLLAIAALLRIYFAGRSGLRPDELFSLGMATGHSLEHPAAAADQRLGDFTEPAIAVPAEEFRRYLQHDRPPASVVRVSRAVLLSDTSPPLYYLLLYVWTLVFGTSDMALRLFSVTCSLGCLPLLAGIARRTGSNTAVVPACALFGFSPVAIYYSAEGRMYSLLWLCVLATVLVSLVLRERARGAGVLALWILVSVAGLLSHYFFVFPWLGMVAYLVISPGKLKRLHLAVSIGAIALLILPWYIMLPQSLAGWRVTKDWLKERPLHFSRVAALRDVVFQFFTGHDKRLWLGQRAFNLPPLVLFASVIVLMLWRLRTRVLDQGRLLLVFVFVAACIGPLAFDLVQHTYTIAWPRYAIAALPAAYLLAAAGVACFPGWTRIAMMCFMLGAWMPNLLVMIRDPSHWMQIREISRAVSRNNGPSDLILVHSIPSGVLGVARYASGPAAMASWVGQLKTRRVPESLKQLAAGRTRILFVKLHEVGEPAPEEDWLRANATVADEKRFELTETVDFRPRDAATF